MGGFIGGRSEQPSVIYQQPAPAAAPPPAPAAVDMTDTIKPVEGATSIMKKPRTKGLLTGETLGGTTLLGS